MKTKNTNKVNYLSFLQQLTLDSPALIDLHHGTIRYRLPDEKRKQENESEGQQTKVKTGYFYHPRLDDFSEGTAKHKQTKQANIEIKCYGIVFRTITDSVLCLTPRYDKHVLLTNVHGPYCKFMDQVFPLAFWPIAYKNASTN